MANTKATKGWHFLPSDMTLGYGDGRKAAVGKTLEYKGYASPQTCHQGMHASHTISDAATFRKGPVLCRVELSGDISDDGNKMAARKRKVIAAKELKVKDFQAIGKAIGHSGLRTASTSDIGVSYLGAAAGDYTYRDKLNKALEKWFNDVKTVEVKPKLTAEILKAYMGTGTVYTKAELEKVFKGFDTEADDDSYHDDLIDELLEEIDAIEVDGFQKTRNNSFGETGFVLGRRSR